MTARGNLLYNSLSDSLNITYDALVAFPVQFLLKFIEIWRMERRCHFLHNSLLDALKYDLWRVGAISFIFPCQIHWDKAYGGCRCRFLYNSASNSWKYGVWWVDAISLTIPYSIHWNMTYEAEVPFPFTMKYDLWRVGAISSIIPYQIYWNMTYGG